MAEDITRDRIMAQIDIWDGQRQQRMREYIAQGMPPEEADDRATHDVRMEIRRSDFWSTLQS